MGIKDISFTRTQKYTNLPVERPGNIPKIRMKLPSTNQIIANSLRIPVQLVRRAFGEERRKPSKAIAAIDTISGAKTAYMNCADDTTKQAEALTKWIELCRDTVQLSGLWCDARNYLVGERRTYFIERWVTLSEDLDTLGDLPPFNTHLTDKERAPIVRKAKEILNTERKAKKK